MNQPPSRGAYNNRKTSRDNTNIKVHSQHIKTNNKMSTPAFSQATVLRPFGTLLQHQRGGMVGPMGGVNSFQDVGIRDYQIDESNSGNNVNGLMDTIGFQTGTRNTNATRNLTTQNSGKKTMNNNLNGVNGFTNHQQFQQQQQQQHHHHHHHQQHQILQQMQLQLQQQQIQGSSGVSNLNPQNMNLAVMTGQQNQNQPLMGQSQQFGGGRTLIVQGQANMQQNQLLGQLMMNQKQQQNGIGSIRNLSFSQMARYAGGNHVGFGGDKSTVLGAPGVAGSSSFLNPLPESIFSKDGSRRMKGGVIEPFPEKLHRLLMEVESIGRTDVISFVANGRAFAIHKADNFFKEIVPLYFRQSRLSSFKRQLNLYGFELINTGPARGGYYHEMFVKERPELCRQMRRVAIKVSGGKEAAKSKAEKSIDKSESRPNDDAVASYKNQEKKPREVTKGNAEGSTAIGKASQKVEEGVANEIRSANGTQEDRVVVIDGATEKPEQNDKRASD